MKTMRILSIVLLLMTGGAGTLGGGLLLTDPTGSKLQLSVDLLKSTPFESYFIPGLVLFLAVGVLSIVTLVLTIFKSEYAARMTVLEGAIIASWIAGQVIMVQMVHPLQIIAGGIGFTLFCLGLFEADDDEVSGENDFTA
jgi:hypothetical protein